MWFMQNKDILHKHYKSSLLMKFKVRKLGFIVNDINFSVIEE